MCCKEKKITCPPNEWCNIPYKLYNYILNVIKPLVLYSAIRQSS